MALLLDVLLSSLSSVFDALTMYNSVFFCLLLFVLLEISCKGLDNCMVENGWVSFVGGSQGLVANYGCELGYIPNDTSAIRYCEHGAWTGHDIHCEGRNIMT